MPNHLNVAIIGCGSVGETHTQCLAQIDGARVVAYCDSILERAKALLDKYGGLYATNDAEKIFRDSNIDVVYVCTYHDTHSVLTIKACEASKNIMIEKPLALTVDECYRVGEAVEKSGVMLMTAFKLRYYPMVKRAKEFISKPLVTVAQMMDSRWPDDFWANDTARGGGNVISQGCHTMDLICTFNRTEPVRIYAEGGNLHHPDLAIIDNIAATVLFQNGSIASVIQGDSGTTPYLSKFSFQLMDGVKTVHIYDRLKTGSFFDGNVVHIHHDSDEYGFLEENREFISALQRGVPVSPNHRDGLRATLLVLKAFEAIKTGVPQEVKL